MKNLKTYTNEELQNIIESIGEKKFRAKQLFEWIHGKRVNQMDDITVLSKKIIEKISLNGYTVQSLSKVKRFDSKDKHTHKYLFKLEDDHVIESVLMKYHHGYSACLSTQVGCRMGCNFCASTKAGLVRNLTAGEIVDQIYQMEKDLNISISNIVLMGTGEPLDNFEEVVKFFRIVHDELGKNLGYRHITLSTCGLVPKIYELANLNIPITLSISLHSPFDDKRKEIMPIANKYSIDEIIKACKYYFNSTGRRITFEYTLIKGVNDGEREARAIGKLIKGLNAHVNLIPLNEIRESELETSTDGNVQNFKCILEKIGVNSTIRREMGLDINAACGQLRKDYMDAH
ncbi:MAG: 23S rRNA (adenine(2503)-C(2))-methyltransferase RlmN [Tissierellales bacterium]|jgi:23S rRNA (adenine2503-C2)-methyltransferase|nr:23S rRNA (adenine(2503)-C(2))-methyltransferase RlmN [Tissierellales bacterium]